MENSTYSEIITLKELIEQHHIVIREVKGDFLGEVQHYPAVIITLRQKSFKIYIDNEYGDLQLQNPILSLYLVLRELEIYAEEKDFHAWCLSQSVNSKNVKIINYYTQLGGIYNEIKQILGTIDSQISNFDFELNAGAIQELRKLKQ